MTDSVSQTGLTVVLVGDEYRIDSRLIAKKLGVEHESLTKIVHKYRTELEELGVLLYWTKKFANGKSGLPQKYAMLNVDQVLFSVLLALPTVQPVSFRLESLMFFLDFTAYHAVSSQTTLFADFMNNYPCNEGNTMHRETKLQKVERQIELALAKSLSERGIHVQRQVKCDIGIADIVTPDAIYEVKSFLTPTRIREGITQVLGYRACINPKAKVYVVGKKWNGKEPETKFAKVLGVNIIAWDD